MEPISKGDWVQVWGQVEMTPNEDGVHPEDFLIKLESHSEHYNAHVRSTHVEPAERTPEFAQPCTALYRKPKGKMVQCQKHYDHGGVHEHGSQIWNDMGTYGYVEVRG
jgi:hypothetical protein